MRKTALVAVFLGSLTLVGARHRAATPSPTPAHVIDVNRSIIVADPKDISGFTLQRVLGALIADSGATDTTPLSLYQQWFDTQNPNPGLAADAPHCDDFLTAGKPSFNGFPRRCPTPEGALATTDPFAAGDYIPIGVTNRFDLTPADGSNCGQYRIIFANTTRKFPKSKLHVIFEPVLPNPNPAAGVEACRPVAQFWADLSGVDSNEERRARIERFFFDGIDGFPPVLRAAYFAAGAGRIRTLQVEPNAPDGIGRFYQFQLETRGSRLLVVPGLLENTPYGTLYNSAVSHPLGNEYRQFFISQVATLAIDDVNTFYDRIPERYLMHESNPENQPPAFSSMTAFNQSLSTAGGAEFNQAIGAELRRIGSALPVRAVLTRADQQNCHGCHGSDNVAVGDGLTFPAAFFGSHVTEIQQQQKQDPTTRFWLSDALLLVYAPHRAKVLSDFLAGKPLPVHSTGTSIAGGSTSD